MKSPLIHLIVAVFVFVSVLSGYFGWYQTVAAESVTVAGLTSQINTKTATETHIAIAKSALTEISSEENVMENYFVSQTGVVSFIDYLDSLGAAQDTTVKILSVAAGGTGSQPTLTISLSVSGTFDAVMRTVGSIEYAPYDLSINLLSVSQTDRSTWNADMTISVGSLSAASSGILDATSTVSTTTVNTPPQTMSGSGTIPKKPKPTQ